MSKDTLISALAVIAALIALANVGVGFGLIWSDLPKEELDNWLDTMLLSTLVAIGFCVPALIRAMNRQF